MSTPNEQVPPQPQYGEYGPPQQVPPQYYAPAPSPALRAPEGTKPYTVWIWLIAVIPVVQLAAMIPYLLFIDSWMTQYFQTMFAAMPPGGGPLTDAESEELGRQLATQMFGSMGQLYGQIGIYWLISQAFNVLLVVFAWLDHRALERRGVPKPFHWGWSFFAFAGAGNLVTVIGRTVVVRRRTGAGLGPIWVTIAVYAVSLIVTTIAIALMMTHLFSSITDYVGTAA